MNKLKSIITIGFLLISFKSFAQLNTDSNSEWVYVTAQNVGSEDTALIYIKTSCVYNDNGIIKIWAKKYSQLGLVKNNYYPNEIKKTLFLFNCRTQQMKILVTIDYNEGGSVIDDDEIADNPNNTWQEIVPETTGEKMINKACELFNK
jgi:hypothetical protein